MRPPKVMPDPRATLLAAAEVIGTFKRQLDRNGWPFPLPPGTDAVLRDIDSIVYEDDGRTREAMPATTATRAA